MQYHRIFYNSTYEKAKLSELGFGCASIGGRVSRRESLKALGAAFDAGITLHDTARSYGYGQSESIVGEFLKARRESIVVCTKFGILPHRLSGIKQKLKPIARTALKFLPRLRSPLQRNLTQDSLFGQFSVDVLKHSLETSLRELKTDHVDILLLHAAPLEIFAQEDLFDAICRLIESGKVKSAGISRDLPVISKFFQTRPNGMTTAQFALNVSNFSFVDESIHNDDLILLGNQPFGGSAGVGDYRSMISRLHESRELSMSLREKLEPGDAQVFPEIALNCVLRASGLRSVIAAMTQTEHVKSNVKAVEKCRFSTEEIRCLREVLQKLR